MSRLLAFSGSLRRDSFNSRLLAAAVAGAADVELIRLDAFALPLYDEDSERAGGLPEGARRLQALVREHSGLLLACPEYNSSFTPLLKNAIDWISRPQPGQPPAFKGKVVGLLSASAGKLGGLRGLRHVRESLTGLSALVLPEQFALSGADQAFDEQGGLREPRDLKAAQAVVQRVREVAALWSRP
ncbi:MAG TPA: NAD(P)H-dependent oxidoreductase [Nevskiaceae bacterium]|nr:NAD(P)H-dependent oxidoreductase [Nevskiaceae bacterium]